MHLFSRRKTKMIDAADALPGRQEAIPAPERHHVLGTPLKPPFPAGLETAVFGMGCFWGAERVFWEAPGVYTTGEAQHEAAESSSRVFQRELSGAGYGAVTTEIAPLEDLFYAEGYHQQYLAKNPNGYCGLGGTGVTCPVGVGVAASSRA